MRAMKATKAMKPTRAMKAGTPDVEGWPRRGARDEDRLEEIGLLETHRSSCGRWCQRGEEQGFVHSPWTVQDQDQGQAGYQGRKENDVRQGGCCEGEASENGRQGVCRRVLETEHLSYSVPWGFLCRAPSRLRVLLVSALRRVMHGCMHAQRWRLH